MWIQDPLNPENLSNAQNQEIKVLKKGRSENSLKTNSKIQRQPTNKLRNTNLEPKRHAQK